ncbi:hypothetical protein KAR34_11235, partial [bacterium]|nr:hypothetical protein [bacterium]
TAYTIIFTINADIRNPAIPGAGYTLSASTTAQTTAGTSPPYAISTSTLPLSVGAVTVVPNKILNIGEYSFDITTSLDGVLVAGTSTISVTFPVGTNVPGSYSAGDITVDGNNVSTANGSGQTVTLTTPINLNASTAYTIVFTTNADIRNPSIPGTGYTLSACTSTQTTAGTSASYTIKPLGTPTVTPTYTVTPTITQTSTVTITVTPPFTDKLIFGTRLEPKIVTPFGRYYQTLRIYFKSKVAEPNIKVRIFNLHNMLIKELSIRNIGDQYLAEWDCRNENKQIKQGIYIYQIEIEGQAVNGTFVIAK